jgi:hypothetical protein
MKKVLLAITAILMTAGIYAHIDSISGLMHKSELNYSNQLMDEDLISSLYHNTQIYQDTTKQNKIVKNHPNGVMMEDGRMWLIKDNNFSLLEETTTMKNGTVVMKNGSYIKKNGAKMMFNEGEHMDMNGKLIPMKGESK